MERGRTPSRSATPSRIRPPSGRVSPSRSAAPLSLLLRRDRFQDREVLRVNRVLRKRLIHLVPALLRPEHLEVRARIPLVADRVVVDAEPEDLAARGDLERLLQLVIEL